jgi:hypothetical protein
MNVLIFALLAVGCSYDVTEVERPCDPDGTCPANGLCQMGRCLACSTVPLQNPGFENGYAGWMGVNQGNLTSVMGGHDSDFAVRVCPGSSNFGVESASDATIAAGASVLELTTWVRSETAVTNETVQSEIEEEPRQLHHHSAMQTINTDWQEVSLSLDLAQTPLDKSTTGFRVLVFWNISSGGVCMQVDDFALRACR